jgi:MFS family permease
MSYLLTLAALLLPIGRIGDIHGRKKIFTIGVITLAVSSFLITLANSAMFLIILRIAQGISGAFMFTTGTAILLSVTPLKDRGKALGINVASTYTGLSLGPFLGGFLTHHLGWRSIFYVIIPITILIVILVLTKLKGEWADAAGEKFDYLGSIVFGVAVISFMFGISQLPQLKGFAALSSGIAGFFLFFGMEKRCSSPIINTKLFTTNRVFVFSNLAALINYAATFATAFLLSLYLQYIKGMDPMQAGMVLFWQPVLMAVFSPLAGRLSDKVEPGIVASAGMALSALGLFLLIPVGAHTNINYIIACLIILGFGFALFSSPNTNAVMSSVEKKHYGVASAILGTMRSIGQALSMGIATLIISLFLGDEVVTVSNHHLFLSSFKTALIVFAFTCVLGVAASMVRGKVRQDV